MQYKNAMAAWNRLSNGLLPAALVNTDCMTLLSALPDNSIPLVISSPPYSMGKEYEETRNFNAFVELHEEVLPEVVRVLADGGSVCWQTGYHVHKNAVMPLDYAILDIVRRLGLPLTLRNRIMWHFGSGQHAPRRFSGRHEVIMWFTKGDGYQFDLDAVRVPQKYPGKKAHRGPNQGEYSGNPLGKNPSDVWDIPNVKANHPEKLDHPCQFPVAMVRRLVRALSKPDDIVMDPFAGVGSTGVGALIEQRRFLGAEMVSSYSTQAVARLQETVNGTVPVRADQAVRAPKATENVSRRPDSWPEVPVSV